MKTGFNDCSLSRYILVSIMCEVESERGAGDASWINFRGSWGNIKKMVR
jgi:hypothetical protein